MNKENYLLSMINGYKRAQPNEGIKSQHFLAALVMLFIVLGPWFYFIKGFNRNTGLFKAPGTEWTFQVGEPEVEIGKAGEMRGEEESEGDPD